ncbi:unnamed protein product, partial [Effrenium voratum]
VVTTPPPNRMRTAAPRPPPASAAKPSAPTTPTKRSRKRTSGRPPTRHCARRCRRRCGCRKVLWRGGRWLACGRWWQLACKFFDMRRGRKELKPLPLCEDAFQLPSAMSEEVKSLLAAGQEVGVWHRQELPVLALDPKPGDYVLDLCASPGSKTLQLLEATRSSDDGGLVVANDASRPRAVVVAQRCRRGSKESLLVTSCDGRDFPSLKRWCDRKIKFQKVLVDAPCSGDGTLRKNPGNWAKWNAKEGNSLHHLQLGLLRRGFECLEPQGRLVYSTCSLNPVEDEAVVAALLAEFPSAQLLPWAPSMEGLQEGLTTWLVPDNRFEQTGTMYSSYAEVPEDQRSTLKASMFPGQAALEQLKLCRRVLPCRQEAPHGGFFVALLTKQKAGKDELEETADGAAEEAEEAEPAAADATAMKDQPKGKHKRRLRGLFRPVPAETLRTIEDFWQLRGFPSERLRLNRPGQVVLATRALGTCFIGKKVELPIVEGACAIFAPESLRPFDEAVPLLAACSGRKLQLSPEEFLRVLEAAQEQDQKAEATDLVLLSTDDSVTVLGARRGGELRCLASKRYSSMLLELLRQIRQGEQRSSDEKSLGSKPAAPACGANFEALALAAQRFVSGSCTQSNMAARLARVLQKVVHPPQLRPVVATCRPGFWDHGLAPFQQAARRFAATPPKLPIATLRVDLPPPTGQRVKASEAGSLCSCGRVKPASGWPQDAEPSCCSKCKTEGMVKLRGSKCRCGRAQPSFGMPGDERAACCSKCKVEGMVDIRSPRCRCGQARPYFGFPNDKRPFFCRKCKVDGMVDIKNRRCMCGKAQPYFGFAGDSRPSCCSQCKDEGMTDIVRRRCRCGSTRPIFGFANDRQPSCCSKCKLDGMVDIRNPRCKCGKARPSFGFVHDAKPSCCSKCKADGMANVVSPRCKCGRSIPIFGVAGDPRPTCCSKCKEEGMIDIKSRRCQMCKKFASYPDAAGRPRQLCAAHSAEVGAHKLSSPGRSRIASEFFDALEAELGREMPFRYRFEAETATWSGEEFAGLVTDRNLQPDAYDPTSGKYLGNYYHGFPPEHVQHGSFTCVGGRPASELHAETMARLDLFLAEGLKVFYIWEHEFKEWQKEVACGAVPSLAGRLHRHAAAEKGSNCRARI